jgi:hypothetical protein
MTFLRDIWRAFDAAVDFHIDRFKSFADETDKHRREGAYGGSWSGLFARLFRRDEIIMRANYQAAREDFNVGRVVEIDGQTYEVTRHVEVPTEPWPTVRIYGRRTKDKPA